MRVLEADNAANTLILSLSKGEVGDARAVIAG